MRNHFQVNLNVMLLQDIVDYLDQLIGDGLEFWALGVEIQPQIEPNVSR